MRLEERKAEITLGMDEGFILTMTIEFAKGMTRRETAQFLEGVAEGMRKHESAGG